MACALPFQVANSRNCFSKRPKNDQLNIGKRNGNGHSNSNLNIIIVMMCEHFINSIAQGVARLRIALHVDRNRVLSGRSPLLLSFIQIHNSKLAYQ